MHCVHGRISARRREKDAAVPAFRVSSEVRRSVAAEQCDLSGLQARYYGVIVFL